MSATTLAPDALARLRARFLAFLPRIRKLARQAFVRITCPDRFHDCIAEVVALVWTWLVRLAAKGRNGLRFLAALIRYAIKRVKTGRRVAGREKPRDPLSPLGRRWFGYRTRSIPPDSSLEGTPLAEVLSDSRRAPVPDLVAVKVDFHAWLASLAETDRRLVLALARGETAKDLARSYGVTPGRISQRRKAFRQSWLAFEGELGSVEEPAAVGV